MIMIRLKTNKLNTVWNHKDIKKTGKCKKIRQWFFSSVGRQFSADSPWLQRHIAQCPRCQKRLASIGRVNLALSVIKAKSHNHDLFLRANTQAISVLKHNLREAPKAQKLKMMKPEPKLAFRLIHCLQPSANIAACLVIIFLMKFGIFSSVKNLQTQSKKAYKQYFVSNIGKELTEDVFPGNFS